MLSEVKVYKDNTLTLMSDKANNIFTIAKIIELVDGKLIEGQPLNGSCTISKILPLEEATADSLTLYTGKSLTKLEELVNTRSIAAILVNTKLKDLSESKLTSRVNLIMVEDPMRAFIKLALWFYPGPNLQPGISPRAEIDPSAVIAHSVSVGAFCVVGPRCEIKDNTVLHPGVVLYADVSIGANCILHSGVTVRQGCKLAGGSVIQNGAVIGSDGFGYIPGPAGLETVPQVGIVELAKNVDIGANSCIDRATMGATRILDGAKLDNLVQVAHNVQIGAHSILCGQVGVAGSTKIGSQVVLGGGVGVADHLNIANQTRFAGHAAIAGDITEKGDYAGYPAIPAKQWRRAMTALSRLGKRSSKDSNKD